MLIPNLLISIILGITLCFFGYRLKKIAFAIVWFVIGFRLATIGVPYIQPYMPADIDPFFIEILPLLVGLLCSLIGTSIERLCVFLMAFAVAFITYFNLVSTSEATFTTFGFGLCAVIGSILGTISVAVMKPAIIFITAYIGSQQIGNLLIQLFSMPNNALLASIILIVLLVAGVLYQFKSTKHLQ